MDLIADVSLLDDDLGLLQHWFRYYRRHGVLRFHLVVTEDPELGDAQVAELLSARDVTRAATYAGSTNAPFRAERTNEYCAAELRQRPCVLAADVDEFIRAPARAAGLLQEQGYDYLPGMLVDRFGLEGRMPPIDDATDLASAFPLCTHFSFHALASNIAKVPVARPGLRYRTGHHAVEERETLHAPAWWLPVDHFKWHGRTIGRIRERLARGDENSKYLEECRTLLERFVLEGERIDLSRIPTWLRPVW
jgi:hypothetical protein